MRRWALIGIILLTFIAINSNNNFQAQENSLPSVQQRIQALETNLNKSNKVFKVLGENTVAGNSKIVQKITSKDSFEILAMPMLETSDLANYSQDFVGKLFADTGLMLSEVKSPTGIRIGTKIPDREEAKVHSFEFDNPNSLPVKVRFYFVQDKLN
ncbi:MAG: hypothetical protein AB7V50_04675 [Vampirovibrionia bacterium]